MGLLARVNHVNCGTAKPWRKRQAAMRTSSGLVAWTQTVELKPMSICSGVKSSCAAGTEPGFGDR